MKRTLFASLFLLTLASGVFAEGFFSHRYFELQVDAIGSVSNNVFKVTDFLQENPVLDFTKIADDLKDGDFNFAGTVKPNIGLALDVPNGLNFGINVGVDGKGNVGLSHSFFDFLGTGHDFTQEDTVTFTMPNSYADMFAVVQLSGGWNFRDWSFHVAPTLYSALLHANVDKSDISALNNDNGEFGYKMDGSVSVYSPISVTGLLASGNKWEQFKSDFSKTNFFDSEIWKGAGFDISASADLRLLKRLTVGVNTQIPIVPSRMNHCVPMTFSSEYMTSISDLTATKKDPEGGSDKKPLFNKTVGHDEIVTYYINRPFRLGLNFDFHPFGSLLKNYGGIELAVAHPFAKNKEETFCYLNYMLGARFSLWDILSIKVSTERTDKVFAQKVQLGFNLRIIEVDVGVSSESASFANSFKLDGAGVYVGLRAGF